LLKMKNLIFRLRYLVGKVFGRDLIFDNYLKNRRVLDVGCGRGEILKKDLQNFFGIDANPTVVNDLQSQGYQARLAEASNLPYPDNQFETVYCSNLIEHLFPDQAYAMLKEANRVLKKHGTIILISPMPMSIWNTFGHIKPYPPLAISKILRPFSLERVDAIDTLVMDKVVYLGHWANNKILFFLTSLVANIFPFCRNSYILILKKNKT